jgi:hypothetical protein
MQSEKEADQDSEEDCIQAQELSHNAMEVSITSSSSRKVHPHIHGIDNKIGGRFWVSGNDSETDEEEDIMVDNMVTSMSNLSIASLARSPVPGPMLPSPIKVSEASLIIPLKEMAHLALTFAISARGSMIGNITSQQDKNDHHPWEGPLPMPRISPKWSLGDALHKGKV